jgi:hypothetical protein
MPPGKQTHAVQGWSGGPRPWPTNVAGGKQVSDTWHADNVAQYLGEASSEPRWLKGRARPLLALPIVGTGFGGKRHVAGDVLRHLMPVLYDHVDTQDVDVVLVAWTTEDFAAANAARRDHRSTGRELFGSISVGLRRIAVELAVQAARDRLVVFMGAGVSAGAGLPTWPELLDGMAGSAGFTDEERDGLANLDPLDRATVIGRRLGDRTAIGAAVAAQLQTTPRHALAHALVAGLPVSEFITTNYDDCFESVCEAVGNPVARLPYAPASQARRWLLKMHGCVHAPADIVLTRQDYVRYAERNAALAGIVQAKLITRHMLFLGFSLKDDNFHRIVDAVRRAVTGADRDSLGSVVTFAANPLMEQLWGDDLDWIHLGDGDVAVAETARRFEVFLDCLSFHAAMPHHLLNPRFEGLLTERERTLREALLGLAGTLAAHAPPSREDPAAPAWAMVEDLLWQLGERFSKSR